MRADKWRSLNDHHQKTEEAVRPVHFERVFTMKNLVKVSALSALISKTGLFDNSLVSADTSKLSALYRHCIGTVGTGAIGTIGTWSADTSADKNPCNILSLQRL